MVKKFSIRKPDPSPSSQMNFTEGDVLTFEKKLFYLPLFG